MGKTKRAMATFLAFVLALTLIPIIPGASDRAEAAETPSDDIFEELGIDTNARPDGYIEGDENPYGKTTNLVDPIAELYVAKRDTTDPKKTQGTYYGHGTYTGSMGEYFTKMAGQTTTYTGLAEADAIKTAAGNFEGTGRKSMFASAMAYHYDKDPAGLYSIYLHITKPDADDNDVTYSGQKLYEGALGNDYEVTNYLTSGGAYFNRDVTMNYLEVATGDFDGNGYDEVAIYVPDPVRPRIDVYQLQLTSANEAWNSSNWQLIFSHNLVGFTKDGKNFAPSIVKLLSADLNRDGVDDLLVGAGACTYDTSYGALTDSTGALYKRATAEVLWGSKKGDSLTKTHNLLADMPVLSASEFFDPIELQQLSPRFDFAYGDLTGTGRNALVIATNTTIALTTFDNTKQKFVLDTAKNFQPLLEKADVFSALVHSDAVITRRGPGQTAQLVWMNKIFTIVDNEITPTGATLVSTAGDTTKVPTYYAVSAADLNGDGIDEIVALVTLAEKSNRSKHGARLFNVYSANALVHYDNAFASGFYALPDTDYDTMTMKYVGRSFQYSDPKLLTVIAAPPTFGDLETVKGDDNTGGDEYIDNSETSFASHKGTGQGDSDSVTLAAGAYVSYEHTINIPVIAQKAGKIEAEVEYKHEWTWDYERMSTETHSVEYTTNGFQDSVALYSIPTDHFIYELEVDDGEGNVTKNTISVSVPYEAVVKVMSVEEYDQIAEGRGAVLPTVKGNVLKHTLGDPATYPSAAYGVNPLVYNGNWAGVGFGFGEISQGIALESEYSEAFSHTDSIDFKFGGGGGNVTAGVVGGASWQRTDVEVSLKGGEATGTVANMPEEARPYGYNYAWKLLWTNVKHNSDTIPVVTYLVREVTAPPRMPQNFTADYAQVTSTSIPLIWDYEDDDILGFQIWREIKTPGMEGKYEALPNGYVPSVKGQTSYTFTDTGLAPATQYTYNIQVMRTKIPQGSVPSGAISVWTHAAVGAPVVSLSSYNLKTYTDKPIKITSSLRNEPAGAVVAGYQWEKLIGGKWTALKDVTTATLSISAPKPTTSGNYRLAVSMTVNNQTVTGYSSPAIIEVDKRTASVAVSAEEDATKQTLTFLAEVKNDFSDSAAIPDGKASFELQKLDAVTGIFGDSKEYTVNVEKGMEAGTAKYTMSNVTEGTYKVRVKYAGNSIFDEAISDDFIHIVGNTSETFYYIELPDEVLYSYVSFTPIVYSAQKTGSGVEVKEVPYSSDWNVKPYNFKDSQHNEVAPEEAALSGSDRLHLAYKLSSASYFNDGWGSYFTLTLKDGSGVSHKITSPSYVFERTPVNMGVPSKIVTQQEAALPTLSDVVFDYPMIEGPSVPVNWNAYVNAFQIKCYNNIGQEVSLNASTAPGVYTVKPVYVEGNHGFNFNSIDATYVVTNATYSVGATAKLLNGATAGSVSVTSPAGNDNVNWTTKYLYGTEIEFTAAPYTRYMVDYWLVNGTARFNGDEMTNRNVLKYKMLAEPVSVEVYFKTKETKLTFEARPDEGGAVELPNNPNFVSGQVMYEQSPLFFKAVPEPGYSFKEWQVVTSTGWSYPEGDIDTDGTHTLSATMPSTDMAVRAVFERASYTINLGDNLTASYTHDHDNNPATPEQEEWIVSGDKVMGGKTLTVGPKPGYTVDPNTWAITPDTAIGVPADQAYTYVVSDNVTITAQTTVESYEVTVQVNYPSNMNAPESSAVTLAGSAGMIELQNGKAIVQGGTSLVITAGQSNNTFAFNSFNIAGSNYTVVGSSATIGALAGNTTIVVNYRENDNYLLKVDGPSNGEIHVSVNGVTTTVPVGGHKIYHDDKVTASALPASAASQSIGYWVVNGNRSGIRGPETREFIVDGALTLGHEFAAANPVKVSWDAAASPMTEVRRAADGKALAVNEEVSAGTSVIAQATLQEDQAIAQWTVNGEPFVVGQKPFTANPLKVTVETDTVLGYTTKQAVYHTLTLNNGIGGTASLAFDRAVEALKGDVYRVIDGAEATLTVTPSAGHTVTVPAVCGQAQVAQGSFVYTFTVSKETMLDIVYAYEAPSFPLSLNQSIGGTIGIAGNLTTATAGTIIKLSKTAEPGYVFDAWNVVDGVGNEIGVVADQFIMPATSVAITATFSKAGYSITYDSTGNGTVIGPSVGLYNETITLAPKPKDGYVLETLTVKKDDGSNIVVGANHTFTMPAGKVTVFATFKLANRQLVGATITPALAMFDKNALNAAHRDAVVTLSPGDYKLDRITYEGKTLKEGTHYTKKGSKYTFLKKFLGQLDQGVRAITFDMNGGEDPVLMVMVSNSMTNDREWMRLAGPTRYDTMSEIIYKGFLQSDTVIVATGENFPDALAASAYAGLSGSPILITAKDALSSQTDAAIRRLKASKVYIIGSTNAVSKNVENNLRALPLVKSVKRIGGSNRYETALKLYYQGEGSWSKTAIVATGEVFADSLSFSPYSYAEKAPIFLSHPQSGLSKESLAALKSGGFTRVLIAGSTAAVPAHVEKQLQGLGATVKSLRLFGSHRFETSARIAQWSVENSSKLGYNDIVVTIGSNFPDALVGGPLAGGKLGSVLLLVDDTETGVHGLTSVIEKNAQHIYRGYYLGSTEVISEGFAARIREKSL